MSTMKTDKTVKDLQTVVDKIAEWPEPYATIGARLHETIMGAGPKLKPRIWYGMPGYAVGRSAPVLVFFRVDDGVMSLGLSEKATAEREPTALCGHVPGSLMRLMTSPPRRLQTSCGWHFADQDRHAVCSWSPITGTLR
ncbi:hypothetical protein SDC9_78022 [bioreactor metagenome]|uniref:YdhG-like domain-containing protein n=1 Tax=bioreactor metagenome TaxID=1076179 RepID=A0A644YT27_9ZZZZ